MKTNVNLSTLALIGVLFVLLLSGWKPQSPANLSPVVQYDQDPCLTGRSIHLTGAAVVNVVPDRALLTLGVETNGATPDGTQNENSKTIQRVISALRALGIDSKDIATDYYIVYPLYDDYNSLTIEGYRIDNTVQITLRDVNLVDDAIIAAFRVGANQVQDVQFYTSELRKYRDQARDLAMKAAGEKAQALAGAAGAQVGCVLSINENSWYQYYGSWWGGRQTSAWAQNVVQNVPSQDGSSSADDSPVSLGQIAVRAEISASYSMK